MVEINSTSLNAVNPPSLSPLSVVSMFYLTSKLTLPGSVVIICLFK